MLALYELLLQDTNIHNPTGITLTEKVIHNLENPETTISYNDNNIYNLLKSLDDKFYEILRKYRNIEKCKEYLSKKKYQKAPVKFQKLWKPLIA